MAAWSPPHDRAAIAGVVRDDAGPVADAVVRVQATSLHVTTDTRGQFILEGVDAGQAVTLTAFAPGYYIAGPVVATAPATDITIQLVRHATFDNASYQWVGARRTAGETTNCQECHSEPGRGNSLLPYDEWVRDAHGTSGVNPRFLSVYNGTDLSGAHRSPAVRYATQKDYGRFPLPPDPSQPYYGPGYRLDAPQTAGNCAACHAPADAANAAYSTDPNALSPVGREGITCDVCHKLWAVKLDRTTGLPVPEMPGVLSMEFRRPSSGRQLFIGPFDDVAGDDTYSPLLNTSAFCAPCHHGQFWGVTVYDSFGEWLDSPYSDPVKGRTCQDCHMPRRGTSFIALQEKGARERRPDTIFSHLMPGAADVGLLQDAVRLEVLSDQLRDRIRVTVRLTNEKAGHHVPTDHPARNMILVVSATDTHGRVLSHAGRQVVPLWGGEGAAPDDYAGRPGKGYAKVLEELWTGVWPTAAYWRQTVLRSDTRIPAKATDVTTYEFLTSAAAGDIQVDARVIFRRAFKALSTQKQWQVPDIVMATSRTLVRRVPMSPPAIAAPGP